MSSGLNGPDGYIKLSSDIWGWPFEPTFQNAFIGEIVLIKSPKFHGISLTIIGHSFRKWPGKKYSQTITWCNNDMTTSLNGNNFRVTGTLRGEPSDNRWIPLTKTSDRRRGFHMFLICAWINGWANNRDGGVLGCHRANYNVTVITWYTDTYTSILITRPNWYFTDY